MTYQLLSDNFFEELTSLYHKAYAENEKLGIHFKAGTISTFEVSQAIQASPTFIKTVDNRIVSTISVRLPWSENPGPFSLPHLGWIATDPEMQGHGYAKNLITEVIEEYIIKDLKAPAVTLGTALEHPWLIETYEKMGFQYLDEKQLFSDHKTVYLIKIFNRNALSKVKNENLQALLKENKNEF
ncbi:GNAT family N-acetyltransferase [Streptococcus sciuri]|uniref:GNAT family N-acetyltransferase n=1 Tax=Streptococcus sciuri TaxID=2973939 RepID=A0ABT2F6X3_9STRE|nr:GNAT family N-acetyltransferase [Streptococcus sciuri]MCS4488226.1 GNAT family N-acetyltransferase [Streptococcus sciuri]